MTDGNTNRVFELQQREISDVFVRQPKPSREHLFLVRTYSPDSEYGQIERFLQRFTSWREICREALRSYEGDETAILSFLSPNAFRYYLPAFLTVALQSTLEEPKFVYAVNSSLLLPKVRKPQDSEIVLVRKSKFTALTENEHQVVKRYLESLAAVELDDDFGATSALKSYWRQPNQA